MATPSQRRELIDLLATQRPDVETSDYPYMSPKAAWGDAYVAQEVVRLLKADAGIRRVLDAGCGNGRFAAGLAAEGFEVVGIDTSCSGVRQAIGAYPGIAFEVRSGYEDLRAHFGETFDACVAIEVIEHLYDPRLFVDRLGQVLRPDGYLILTTPYHGYLKNVALAVSGRMDSHFGALWDGGHVKFWSRVTLTALLVERGFRVTELRGTGRIPLLWKSMIALARKQSRLGA
jgi:2-polyprenyl-3-methyl-5-hydroxy-6-metoxy-1,4-benzoquinol methylase